MSECIRCGMVHGNSEEVCACCIRYTDEECEELRIGYAHQLAELTQANEKDEQTIGNLYRIKELYRTHGMELCWAVEAMILKIIEIVSEEDVKKIKPELDEVLDKMKILDVV